MQNTLPNLAKLKLDIRRNYRWRRKRNESKLEWTPLWRLWNSFSSFLWVFEKTLILIRPDVKKVLRY